MTKVRNFLMFVVLLMGAGWSAAELPTVAVKMDFKEWRTLETRHGDEHNYYLCCTDLPDSVYFTLQGEKSVDVLSLLQQHARINKPVAGIVHVENHADILGKYWFPADRATEFFQAIVEHVQSQYNLLISAAEFEKITSEFASHNIDFKKPEGLICKEKSNFYKAMKKFHKKGKKNDKIT